MTTSFFARPNHRCDGRGRRGSSNAEAATAQDPPDGGGTEGQRDDFHEVSHRSPTKQMGCSRSSAVDYTEGAW